MTGERTDQTAVEPRPKRVLEREGLGAGARAMELRQIQV